MKKLCVAGCSVSDYTDVEFPYGHLMADDLGLEYLHEGDWCHFNQYGHRVMADKLIERIKELKWA
jgi:lysophospholipase L1-like esterase